MAFAVTADPQRFDEAVDWFGKRIVLTPAAAQQLGAEAGRRAFWIGGGLQLTQIQRVFDKIGLAIEDGVPFDEWRKSVKDELRNDAHAETVFRNATQRSLNAGRWQQMREPGVLAFRPYGLFDGIADSRQSPICKECDGTILPLDHAWWATHSPLLHHRCRSSVRNLRASEAQRRGVTNVPPIIDADDGFGLSPEDEPVWKPDPATHDRALLTELGKKEGARKPPPKPRTAPVEHDPKHWEAEYSKQYGEAAPTVAWGRAMLERGLDRSGRDVADHLGDLRLAGHPSLQGDAALDAINQIAELGNKRLRRTLTGSQNRYLVALAEHTRSITPGDPMKLAGPAGLPRSTKAFYDLGLDKSVRRPNDWKVTRVRSRSSASGARKRIKMRQMSDDGVWTHEIAHAIEFENPQALQRSLAYLRARTAGDAPKRLADLHPGRGYRRDETARPDQFLAPYMGKDYGHTATEVTSMGYEWLHDGPMLRKLQADDPDTVLFLLGQLAGR